MKHTFGRRLRAAGVSFEDRQDLLGHKSSRITTHYSAAELHNLIEATNKVCALKEKAPSLLLLRKNKARCDGENKTSMLETGFETSGIKSRNILGKEDLMDKKIINFEELETVSRKSPANLPQAFRRSWRLQSEIFVTY